MGFVSAIYWVAAPDFPVQGYRATFGAFATVGLALATLSLWLAAAPPPQFGRSRRAPCRRSGARSGRVDRTRAGCADYDASRTVLASVPLLPGPGW